MFVTRKQLSLGLGAIVTTFVLITTPVMAGCMYDICGDSSDAVDGTTIRVEVNFPPGHKDHAHMILITGVDANNNALWWEEVENTGKVFEAIVPKSVRDKIMGVDAMIEGPPDEFESAQTPRVKGPLPLGVMLLPIKRSMFQ